MANTSRAKPNPRTTLSWCNTKSAFKQGCVNKNSFRRQAIGTNSLHISPIESELRKYETLGYLLPAKYSDIKAPPHSTFHFSTITATLPLTPLKDEGPQHSGFLPRRSQLHSCSSCFHYYHVCGGQLNSHCMRGYLPSSSLLGPLATGNYSAYLPLPDHRN